ncbi:cupin domain-containing protein [[Eubacterium] cellulosolvens]
MQQDESSQLGQPRFKGVLQKPKVIHHLLKDDGIFPNNGKLPLLVYQDALGLPSQDPASVIEEMFEKNHWGGSWRNGVYSFHHYHSTAHEVLGVFDGTAQIQFGGDQGVTLSVSQGDIVIIPAGVAHKNINSTSDFRVVGAYPVGQSWDICYGKLGERPQTDHNIQHVAMPKSDPIYGKKGAIVDFWFKQV